MHNTLTEQGLTLASVPTAGDDPLNTGERPTYGSHSARPPATPPQQPPYAGWTPVEEPPPGVPRLSSWGRRFAAYMLDTLILYFGAAVVSTLAYASLAVIALAAVRSRHAFSLARLIPTPASVRTMLAPADPRD